MTKTAMTMTVAVAAVSLGSLAGGLAAGVADAQPGHQRTFFTDDGWKATIASTNEKVRKVAPLSSVPTSREAFMSMKATSTLTPPAGQSNAPIKGEVEAGYMIGCAVQLEAVTGSVGASLGIGGSGGGGVSGAGPSGSLSISPQALIQPSLSITMSPGKITTVTFDKKAVGAGKASTTTREGHISIDGCAGPVAVRSYAILKTSTPKANDGSAVYGKVVYL
ncbi:MspA family porin [Gordonia alkanivorans]|uniref:MspA family porin n=1 Tax=Gordonia alkanivorans TaxID=84096 RepID=UPI00244BD8F6|nr:MspA family porin [Gordonia alkanivorans]MDH3013903.1 MspA family porin [Gordonia alkanivorans]